jgi:hypothetical protein
MLSNSCKKPRSSAHSGCTSVGDSATLLGRNILKSSSSNQVTLAPQHAGHCRVRFSDNPIESRQEVITPVTIMQAPAHYNKNEYRIAGFPGFICSVDCVHVCLCGYQQLKDSMVVYLSNL